MRKRKTYSGVRFGVEVLEKALAEFDSLYTGADVQFDYHLLNVRQGDQQWSYDTIQEFLADHRSSSDNSSLIRRSVVPSTASLSESSIYRTISVDHYRDGECVLEISSPHRSEIEKVFNVFELAVAASRIEVDPTPVSKPIIFVGHGRDAPWRDLKDHLQDKHGYQIEAYETGSRAGHTIRDILEEMSAKSSLAFLVMTGEDLSGKGITRARQNVIHEVGLFQGALGFSRAITLVEQGVELFSNLDGVQQIRFSKGNIKECFGEVLATIRREFP